MSVCASFKLRCERLILGGESRSLPRELLLVVNAQCGYLFLVAQPLPRVLFVHTRVPPLTECSSYLRTPQPRTSVEQESHGMLPCVPRLHPRVPPTRDALSRDAKRCNAVQVLNPLLTGCGTLILHLRTQCTVGDEHSVLPPLDERTRQLRCFHAGGCVLKKMSCARTRLGPCKPRVERLRLFLPADSSRRHPVEVAYALLTNSIRLRCQFVCARFSKSLYLQQQGARFFCIRCLLCVFTRCPPFEECTRKATPSHTGHGARYQVVVAAARHKHFMPRIECSNQVQPSEATNGTLMH
jgi:hypothetical protein